MIYRDLYESGVNCLKANNCKEAVLDARLLLEFVCHTNRNDLLAHGEREVSEADVKQYEAFIRRRATGEPLQYITGEQDFMGLTFKTHESTLIPRHDTECLVEEAMMHLHDGMRILDMCSGSGCILLSLLKYSNDCIGVGAEVQPEAVALAQENAGNLGIGATFIESDLFSQVQGKYDLIVSNPPYIESEVIKTLDREVREHEPMSALDGGTDGLEFYRRIADEARGFLSRGGMLFFEIGYNQAEAVSELLRLNGYIDIVVKKDLAGLDRVVYATYAED